MRVHMLCPLEHPAHMHSVTLRNRTLPFLHPLTVSMTSHVHDPEEGGGLGETRSSIGHLVPSHGASRREPEPDALWPLCRPGRRCVASQRCTALHRARSLAGSVCFSFFSTHSSASQASFCSSRLAPWAPSLHSPSRASTSSRGATLSAPTSGTPS